MSLGEIILGIGRINMNFQIILRQTMRIRICSSHNALNQVTTSKDFVILIMVQEIQNRQSYRREWTASLRLGIGSILERSRF